MDLEPSTVVTLVVALATVLLGAWINRRSALLERSNVPPAVTAGLLLSLLALGLARSGVADLRLDTSPRDWLLLLFFATLGLGARLNRLASAGRGALVLCVAIALLAVIQNLVGLVLARLLGEAPALGAFVGGAAYLGGHGTATAWAGTPQVAHLDGALEVGLGSATLGLLVGALVAGPLAAWLARRAPATAPGAPLPAPELDGPPRTGALEVERWLPALLTLLLCVAAGGPLRELLGRMGLPIPGFLAVLCCAVLVTNVADRLGRPVDGEIIDLVGAIALNLFLAIAMLTLDWAALAHHLPLLLGGALLQLGAVCLVAVAVVFPLFGRDREAAVAAGGFVGFGLGAMPVGLAVMRRLNQSLGATPRALLAFTMAASLFTDAANSVVLMVFLKLTG